MFFGRDLSWILLVVIGIEGEKVGRIGQRKGQGTLLWGYSTLELVPDNNVGFLDPLRGLLLLAPIVAR